MGAVQQYIDLYRSQKDLINGHSSAVMNGLREEAVSLLESRGLPSLKDEEHRRTDIESVYSPDYGLNLGRIDIETNPYEVFRCDVPNLSTLLYFVVNDSFYKRVQPVSSKLTAGVFVCSLCDMSLQYPDLVSRYYGKGADMKRDGTVALNTAFAQDGFFLYIPPVYGIRMEYAGGESMDSKTKRIRSARALPAEHTGQRREHYIIFIVFYICNIPGETQTISVVLTFCNISRPFLCKCFRIHQILCYQFM